MHASDAEAAQVSSGENDYQEAISMSIEPYSPEDAAAGRRSITCPNCCGEGAFAFAATDRNRRISTDIFEYYRCSACRLLFLSNVPENLHDYYSVDYYRFTTAAGLRRRARKLEYQIQLLLRFVDPGRLLEIGPGTGTFSLLAKDRGFDVETMEIDSACCAYLQEEIGVRTIQTARPASALRADCYDAIALWHSLEHLPDAFLVLARAKEAIRSGGVLLIATPNPEAYQFECMNTKWPHIDAPRHLFLIPLQVIKSVLADGFRLEFCTSNDPGGRGWNRFGWARFVLNELPPRLLSVRGLQFGALIFGELRRLCSTSHENRPMKGCAYTAIFRRI
jgi:SAM-dependent methyltransferase